jgi:hypothetical protein
MLGRADRHLIWNIFNNHGDRSFYLATYPSVFIIYDGSGSHFSNVLCFCLILVCLKGDSVWIDQNHHSHFTDQLDLFVGLINGSWCESFMWSQVSAPVFCYSSFRESSNWIHTNQHTGPQGNPESDFRVNLVSRRLADWTIPRCGSACVRADKLLDSDVGRSL